MREEGLLATAQTPEDIDLEVDLRARTVGAENSFRHGLGNDVQVELARGESHRCPRISARRRACEPGLVGWGERGRPTRRSRGILANEHLFVSA